MKIKARPVSGRRSLLLLMLKKRTLRTRNGHPNIHIHRGKIIASGIVGRNQKLHTVCVFSVSIQSASVCVQRTCVAVFVCANYCAPNFTLNRLHTKLHMRIKYVRFKKKYKNTRALSLFLLIHKTLLSTQTYVTGK